MSMGLFFQQFYFAPVQHNCFTELHKSAMNVGGKKRKKNWEILTLNCRALVNMGGGWGELVVTGF